MTRLALGWLVVLMVALIVPQAEGAGYDYDTATRVVPAAHVASASANTSTTAPK